MVSTSFTHCPFYLLWCDTNAPRRWSNLHKTNAANEELVSRLVDGRKVQRGARYTDCSYHSNSLSNKMGNSLLAVRGINHKYIVVEGIVPKWQSKEIGDLMDNEITGWEKHGTHRFPGGLGIQRSWKRIRSQKDKDGFVKISDDTELPFE